MSAQGREYRVGQVGYRGRGRNNAPGVGSIQHQQGYVAMQDGQQQYQAPPYNPAAGGAGQREDEQNSQ